MFNRPRVDNSHAPASLSLDKRRERTLVDPRVGRESPTHREWDALVARVVAHQLRIEAAFDRADACERIGDFEHALGWLDRADAISGGLSPAYRARRARLSSRIGPSAARPGAPRALERTPASACSVPRASGKKALRPYVQPPWGRSAGDAL
jgi:hypothetical protein